MPCCWIGDNPSKGWDINGHLSDNELGIFMVGILVYSLPKWIWALLAKLSDNMELKSEFHHFCLSIARSDILFFWETQTISLAKHFNVGLVEQYPAWKNGGQSLLWHQGTQLWWCCEAEGTGWLSPQLSRVCPEITANNLLWHRTHIHQVTRGQEFWRRRAGSLHYFI